MLDEPGLLHLSYILSVFDIFWNVWLLKIYQNVEACLERYHLTDISRPESVWDLQEG